MTACTVFRPRPCAQWLQDLSSIDHVKVIVSFANFIVTHKDTAHDKPLQTPFPSNVDHFPLLLARMFHQFENEDDLGRPERFSESFDVDQVSVE